MPDPLRPAGARRALLAPIALALSALGLLGLFLVRWRAGDLNAWGWDESMHAALPGGRIALAVGAGDWRGAWDAVHDCERYPPVAGVVLASAMAVFGLSELVARVTLLCLWLALGIGGLAALGRVTREALWAAKGAPLGLATGAGQVQASQLRPEDDRVGRHIAAYGAAAFGLMSPLANRYAPTLFLESLFAALAVIATWAHLRARRPGAAPLATLGAGVALAVVCFTKWNYGVLFLAALGLDACFDLLQASRAGALRAVALRWLLFALPLALASIWWFALPLPFGGEVAARHRAECLDYLWSNQEMAAAPWWMRRLAWYRGVATHPAMLFLLVLGALRSLRFVRVPEVRTLWLLLLVIGLPATLHQFFLDRFLIVPAMFLFVLAAIGWADGWTGTRPARASAAVVLCAAVMAWALVPVFDLAVRFGFPVAASSEVAAYQRGYVHDTLGPFGAPASNGLPHRAHEALLARIAGAVGPEERVGWVGQSQEVSPASLHFGLLAHGGSPARFRADAEGPMDLWPVPGVPDQGFDGAAVLAWAAGFDVLVLCTPVDLKGRPNRAWIAERWQAPLLAGGWRAESLGALEVPKPPGPAASVEVRIARRE
ncbi:MAG: hypothetical protein R3F49_19135 [Planctomycetota bacterium]